MTTPKESGWRERFDEQFCRESSWPGGGLDLLEGNREEVIAFIAQVEATAIAATEARVVEKLDGMRREVTSEDRIESAIGAYGDEQYNEALEDVRALFSSKTPNND